MLSYLYTFYNYYYSAFSPLTGFMHEEDYNSVVANMRLTNGLLFGLPVVFDSDDDNITVGDKILLTYQGQNLAVFTVESKWKPNKPLEARNCYGTTSIEHPAVQMISMERGKYYMGGEWSTFWEILFFLDSNMLIVGVLVVLERLDRPCFSSMV